MEDRNVICGHPIPAGTGLREYEKLVVASMDDYQRMAKAKLAKETVTEE